jgi:alkylation response protein AidB-like acyl-CoA dehydrogenase
MTHPFGLDNEALEYTSIIDKIATEVTAKHAQDVDANARFPRESIDALRESGLFGLVSAKEVGGKGQGLRVSAAVVERLARECASTAMITMMHYCGTMVVEAHGSETLRSEIASGKHLTTLAFSESGSRSHFWVPVSTATAADGQVKLNAKKQLITSAGECDGYVWSSKPASAEGLSSIWWVPSSSDGLSIPTRYEGLGLRGNGSAPIHAEGVSIPESNRLGDDGAGFDVMMGNVLPPFCMMGQAVSVGIMEGAIGRTVGHVSTSKYGYSGETIAGFPQVRAKVATMRTKADMCKALLLDGLTALETGRPDAQLRVLQSKVAGAETALEVVDLAMRATGGAAYRKDIALERYFRDARAASVMAPVTDALLDFIGKAVCGMPLFE